MTRYSTLAAIAAHHALTPAEAVVLPAVLDRFADAAGLTPAAMLRELAAGGELLAYFGDVCREVAASDAGRKVAAEGGFA